MRTTIIGILFASACAVPPAESLKTEEISTYCNAPEYIQCHPNYPGGDNSFCAAACNAFDGVYGYCPEYTQAELDYCTFHPDEVNRCSGGYPISVHRCVTGYVV